MGLMCGGVAAQNPDAIFKLLRYEWTVNADGTSDYHYRHEVQILRNRALTAYADKGETFVVFNPDIEELTVNEVYTIRKDGSRVEMPQNAFIYQLPQQCADCGRFNHIRELAMVHTGMELGCTVVVDYTLHRRFTLVNVSLPLVRECPVERLEVKVNVPAGQKLTTQLYRGLEGEVEGTLTESKSETAYSLVCTNMQQRFTDPFLPDNLYPALRLFNGTPEFSPAFSTEGFDGADMQIKKVIGRGTDIERVANIRNYVVDCIHLNDIDPAKLGYTHSPAAEVWRTGCGTATDKAELLAGILRREGYKAQVVGETMDLVSVTIDTLEYRLGVRSKAALTPYGEAKDAVASHTSVLAVDKVELDTLEGGFFGMKIAEMEGSPSMKASQMALTRKAPLQAQACDLDQSVTYTLPKGMKMVQAAVDEKAGADGIGSVSVSISQSGRKLKVQRTLKLDGGVVAAKDYPSYRKLLATWQGYDYLLLRGK